MSIRGNRRRRAREREARKAEAHEAAVSEWRARLRGLLGAVRDTMDGAVTYDLAYDPETRTQGAWVSSLRYEQAPAVSLTAAIDLIRRPAGATPRAQDTFPACGYSNETDPEMLERFRTEARRMEAESRFVPMYDARDITWTPLPTRDPANVPTEIVFRAEFGE
jgi:hypothetical protein